MPPPRATLIRLFDVAENLPPVALSFGFGNANVQSIWSQISLYGTSSGDNLTATEFVRFVYGLGSIDLLTAGDDATYLFGGLGNDILKSGVGADLLDGGGQSLTGFGDTASYSRSTAGVSVNLSTGQANGGYATGDTLIDIESLSGSAFEDFLTGDAGNNQIRGRGGDDVIDGKGGNDLIRGDGNDFGLVFGDLLTGGTGDDVFAFRFENDSGGTVSKDVITDFGIGDDTISFDGFFSSGEGPFEDHLGGAFTFTGAAPDFQTDQSEIIFKFQSDATFGNVTSVKARFLEDDGVTFHNSEILLVGQVSLQASDFDVGI